MKKIILISHMLFLLSTACLSQNNDGFVSLFNGEDLTNWTLNKKGGFEIADGELITRSSGNGYDIYLNEWYGNFIFRFEFLLSKTGNSGVFIRSMPAEEYPSAGVEIQLLAPWTPWRDNLHCTGSIYGHVAVTNRPDETPGIWHEMEIKCDRHVITISVDDKVTTMAKTDTVKTMASVPLYGAIGFQGSHTSKPNQFARFRNIFIRNLDVDPNYVTKGFYEENEQLRKLTVEAAVKLGAVMIQPLANLMAGENPVAKNGARQALFDLTAMASDPKTSKDRKMEVFDALKKSMKKSSSPDTRIYLKSLSAMLKK